MLNREQINHISEVIDRCNILKNCNMWPNEEKIRPRAWLDNFEKIDQPLAASLLDRFVYHNEKTVEKMFESAYQSLCDNLPKGPFAPGSVEIMRALPSAVFTSITGEDPNPTDSGNLFLRMARQRLGIPEDLIVSNEQAIRHAMAGNAVVFIDDFVGSGQQFLRTWHRAYTVNGKSHRFKDVHEDNNFVACYVNLISLDYGLKKIYETVPSVAISVAHILDRKSTVQGLFESKELDYKKVDTLLDKYHQRLSFSEDYMSNNVVWRKYGFYERGLLMAFHHSVPDATLPIFWCSGPNWKPLIERS